MSDYLFVKRFSELSLTDVPIVGGKNASLAEMYRELSTAHVKVPNGFATTSDAYWTLLDTNDLRERISDRLKTLDKSDIASLKSAGSDIRSWILHATLPEVLIQELAKAYSELCSGEELDVAVRSSATAEDLPNASFAGQQETYLNVKGLQSLLDTCRSCYASLFTDRAISYRVDQSFDHMKVALSIGIQRMVRSDVGSSGVIFTVDTESGFDQTILVTGSYGLGENIVQGAVNPDEFQLFKPALEKNCYSIIRKSLGEKAIKLVYSERKTHQASVTNVAVKFEARNRFCLSDDEVEELGRQALAIEKHYSKLAGKYRPMDIEWAKDGFTNELFIVQARPETVHSQKQINQVHAFQLTEPGQVLLTGKSIGSAIATGKTKVILEASHMSDLNPGDVLVTDITDPDWEPIMKIASAIVTNRGGRTCHAAIIARELGIPAIVGTRYATEVINDGNDVTVCCAEGEVGKVYQGQLAFRKESHTVEDIEALSTKIMVNLGNPQKAFETQYYPNDGVGLARLEFIISSTIGIHPNALLNYAHQSETIKNNIDERIAGYSGAVQFYIDKLAEGVSTIAAAFYPKPVIVRLSDFKSNEYRQLIGGEDYEPNEENPMIGLRGASRFIDTNFSAAFGLECTALKKVRETMGLTNVALMVPFVRSVNELTSVIEALESNGLKRGQNGLKLYVMCEIPANALLADEFLQHCDGFSIGSNDLTQLTLGVDRDSQLVSGHDERDEAVMALMKMAIASCRKHGKYIGICGQAPSDWPEITEWLVKQGIESMSLNPDSLIEMRNLAAKVERSRRDNQ